MGKTLSDSLRSIRLSPTGLSALNPAKSGLKRAKSIIEIDLMRQDDVNQDNTTECQ